MDQNDHHFIKNIFRLKRMSYGYGRPSNSYNHLQNHYPQQPWHDYDQDQNNWAQNGQGWGMNGHHDYWNYPRGNAGWNDRFDSGENCYEFLEKSWKMEPTEIQSFEFLEKARGT